MSKILTGTICTAVVLSAFSVVYFLASISKDISSMESRFAKEEARRIEAEKRAERIEERKRDGEEKEKNRIIKAAKEAVIKKFGSTVVIVDDGFHHAFKKDDGEWLASIVTSEATESSDQQKTIMVTLKNSGYVVSID